MLILNDGFQRGRSELKSEVAHLQRTLIQLGYAMKADGFYGESTKAVIAKIQADKGVEASGHVDDATWLLIESALEQEFKQRHTKKASPLAVENKADSRHHIDDFRGDLNWIHQQEGHSGKAYWPGGRSGITLDPGFDMGYQTMVTVKEYYQSMLNQEQLKAIEEIVGLHGDDAKRALSQSAALSTIHISREQAATVFPIIAEPYWTGICKKMPGLTDALGSVQTALLSLAFNRGYNNRHLSVLKAPISQKQWKQCAEIIAAMQQDHKLKGIQTRRRREGQLILDELAQ